MKARRTLQLAMLWLMAMLGAAPAGAQIALPRVELPSLPVTPPVLNRTLDTAGAGLDEVRRLRIRELLRSHRRALEADPRGAPAIRGEVVAFASSDAALRGAVAAGFEIARQHRLEGLDATLVVLRAPAGLRTRRALEQLRRADPQGSYDFNHLYMESGAATSPAAAAGAAQTPAPAAASETRVGLVDGGVDLTHPALIHSLIHAHGCATAVPSAHGTAVASLIAGDDGPFQGVAPGAQLYVADVYCGQPIGGAVDAVADALGWMAREGVPVINVSLVGPDNRLLERVVRLMLGRGHLIVASVGNDGPNAPPLFPAAYRGVIGVTGVDARDRILLEACRGPHVMFAAPGADIIAAALDHRYAAVRGTSFAAPIVAALLAGRFTVADADLAAGATAQLAEVAVDLGAPGPDKIYGRGLVGASVRASLVAQ